MNNRPRLRFSLRTLFVLVTVGCVWLGWQANIVAKRKRVKNWIDEHHGWFNFESHEFAYVPIDRTAELPWIRRAMGDKHTSVIELRPGSITLDEIRWIESTYPEAIVKVGEPGGPRSIAPSVEGGVESYNADAPVY